MEKVARGGAGRAGMDPRPVFASLLSKALGHFGGMNREGPRQSELSPVYVSTVSPIST